MDDTLARAVAHGSAHVIKLTDAALASHQHTGKTIALTAASTAVELNA